MNAGRRAQEIVGAWLADDFPVFNRAGQIARGELPSMVPAGGSPVDGLARFVREVLMEDSGGYYRALCRQVPADRFPDGHPVDRGSLRGARDSITRDEFDGINWPRLAAALFGIETA